MSSSILASYSRAGHSADVKMHLVIGEEVISIGQLGPDFVVMDHPFDHPPTEAILFFSIDGKERRRPIRLPHGISAASPRIAIEKA